MYVKCAWCGKDLGQKPPFDNKSISHSICLECRKKMEEQQKIMDKCTELLTKGWGNEYEKK